MTSTGRWTTMALTEAAGWSVRPRLVGALRGQQAAEERAVALERDSQVLGGDVLAAAPLRLEALALLGEALGEALHDGRHEGVGVLDGAARLVDEADLDLLPAALEALGVREERVVVAVAVGRCARAGRGGAGVAGGRVARAGVADRGVAGGGAGRRGGGGGRGALGGVVGGSAGGWVGERLARGTASGRLVGHDVAVAVRGAIGRDRAAVVVVPVGTVGRRGRGVRRRGVGQRRVPVGGGVPATGDVTGAQRSSDSI